MSHALRSTKHAVPYDPWFRLTAHRLMTVTVAGLVLCLLPLAAPAAAQGSGKDGVPSMEEAESALLRGDSAAALAMYGQRTRANRKDAHAWHQQGLLAWRMARAGRTKFPMDPKDIQLITLADSALRLAAYLSPDSANYHTALGRFMLNANVVTMRVAAYAAFDNALAAAKRSGNAFAVAEAADEVGMIAWRRYESLANRRQLRGHDVPDIDPEKQDAKAIRNYVEDFTMKLREFPGEGHYRTAIEQFEAALKAMPGHPRAQRHLFMAHAELGNWEELKQAARNRISNASWDPMAWLALGLATHRLNEEREATQAFDSAMMFLSEEDRIRYNALQRIVRPSDSTGFASSPTKDYTTEKYWILSDPLWLTPYNEHRLEFLSRVAFAELRWTSDDFDLRGADTDRGDIHIRYGPPDELISLRGGEFNTLTTTWIYRSGLTFVFTEPPTWGTARHSSYEHARTTTQTNPVRWDNVATDRRTDSVRVQLSRFRAGRDSSDILMVAHVPIDSLVRDVELTRAPVEIDFQMFDEVFKRVVRDSTRYIVTPGTPSGAEIRAWRRRIPSGLFLYRIEALQPDAYRGARAVGTSKIGRDSTFKLTGFSMSDVVVADRVEPRASATSGRWSEFNIVPGVGVFRTGQSIALLWETYELSVRENSNRYTVEVSLTKLRREGALGMAMTVVGGVGAAVGVTERGKGKVVLRYDRNIAAQESAVDYLTVDLGQAPTGRYLLRVDVIDKVSGKRAFRERFVTIVP